MAEKEKINDSDAVLKALRSEPKVKIMIPSTEADQTDVNVGVNGVAYQIKRDVPVSVPKSIVEVLKNATMTLYRQAKRSDGEGMELIPYEAMRYPFQILGTENG